MRRFVPWTRSPVGLGVDVGSAGVKAVALTSEHGRVSLLGAGREALPPGAVRNGVVGDVEGVGAALARLLARLGVRCRPVTLAIGGSSVLVKRFPAPPTPAASGQDEANGFREAVAREAARHVPFHLESLEFDYEGPLPATPDPATSARPAAPGAVVFGAAPRETIRSHCRAMSCAGREVRRIELEPYALYAAVRLEGRLAAAQTETGAFAIVEIGATRASVHVFRHGPESPASPGAVGDLLASVFAPGAGARAFGMEPARNAPARFGPPGAAKLGGHHEIGWREHDGDQAAVWGTRIAAAVREALQEAATGEPVRLRISGGGAGHPAVQAPLRELALGDPVVLDPLERLGFREQGPAFALAAGLAYQQWLDAGGSGTGQEVRP